MFLFLTQSRRDAECAESIIHCALNARRFKRCREVIATSRNVVLNVVYVVSHYKASAYSASLGTRFARLGSLRIASPACAAVTRTLRLCVSPLLGHPLRGLALRARGIRVKILIKKISNPFSNSNSELQLLTPDSCVLTPRHSLRSACSLPYGSRTPARGGYDS